MPPKKTAAEQSAEPEELAVEEPEASAKENKDAPSEPATAADPAAAKPVPDPVPERGPKGSNPDDNDYAPLELEEGVEAPGQLLPYLALGFTPMVTSGGRSQCGLHSLRISLDNAREHLRKPGSARLPNVKIVELQAWGNYDKCPEYKKIVDDYLEYQGFSVEEKAKEKIELRRLTEHDNRQLAFILEVANQKLGTNFQLGIISQGWSKNAPKKTKPNEYLPPTVTQILDQITTDDPKGNIPILWIWNSYGGTSGISHWEGMGVDKRTDAARMRRRRVVEGWCLRQAWENDVRIGVWALVEDSPPGYENMLNARQGTFVRDAPVLKGIDPPEGFRYVQTSSGLSVGLVLESGLLPIGTRVEGAAAAPAKTAPQSKITGAYTPDWKPLKFFRAIPFLDKVGKPLSQKEIAKMTVIDFTIQPGEFLFDERIRDGSFAHVKNLEGEEGVVRLRGLQPLEDPWKLPLSWPFLPELDLEADISLDTLRAEATKRKIEFNEAEEDHELKEKLKEFEDGDTHYLPLWQVTDTVTITDSSGIELEFLEGELVFAVDENASEGPGRDLIARDYEGFQRAVSQKYLEPVNQPWGLRFSTAGLPLNAPDPTRFLPVTAFVDPNSDAEVSEEDDQDPTPGTGPTGGQKRPASDDDDDDDEGGPDPKKIKP